MCRTTNSCVLFCCLRNQKGKTWACAIASSGQGSEQHHLSDTRRPGGSGGLTDAGGKGLVPHPPVPAQTRQRAAAVEAVPRVARVQNVGVGEMAVVLDFVAITGDARLLAADKVKTWKGQAQMEAGHTGRSFCGVWRRQRRPLEKTSHSE